MIVLEGMDRGLAVAEEFDAASQPVLHGTAARGKALEHVCGTHVERSWMARWGFEVMGREDTRRCRARLLRSRAAHRSHRARRE
jgi:hypothetical protein